MEQSKEGIESERRVSSRLFEQLQAASQADNTRIAYAKGWRCFVRHCERHGIAPLSATPEQAAEFFAEAASQPSSATGKPLSVATLTIYRSAISRRYAEAGCDSPAAGQEVKDVLRGIARLRDERPRQAAALRDHHLVAILKLCSGTPIGLRDAALLSVGFAAALRRSELCSLTVDDVEFEHEDRMVIRICRSKTDQVGEGQRVAVPEGKSVKPVSRLRAWLSAGRIREGCLFQTMRRGGKPTGRPLHHSDVSRLVKHYATRIGLDPKEFSAHSLRAGFVTSAAAHHARLDKIMEVTRHRSADMVMRYVRDAEMWTDHAGAAFL